jgi:hypothetical protein
MADHRSHDVENAYSAPPAYPPPTPAERIEYEQTDYQRVWSPSQIAPLAAGVLFIVFGLLAVIKGGLGGPIDRPFVDVFGYAQTPLLGLIELGTGAVLLLIGLTPGARNAGIFVGALVAVAGGLVLGDLAWVNAHLTTDTDFGWIPLVAGAAVVVVLAVVPTTRSRHIAYHA